MAQQDSQELEGFLPVYDSIPDSWEEAREFLVENLKKISNAINVRTIGFFLDEELLSGQQFIPTAYMSSNNSSNSQQFRAVFRKVVDVSPLVLGVNVGFSHGITFDVNFTLIDLWVAGTNSTTFTAKRINGNDILMTATQLQITSPQAFDRAFAIIEFIQEQ